MKKLMLVGNPNVGKSVVFQQLTGAYAEVSNYPGTTVDIMTGSFPPFSVTDTPGVFGLSSLNEEERVTYAAVKEADLILNIVDGTQLVRDLFLTLQLLELGKPMVIAVNMMDEVKKQHLFLDLKGLEKDLGVPMIPISARKKEGIGRIREELRRGGTISNAVPFIRGETGWDPDSENRQRTHPENNQSSTSENRRIKVNSLVASYVSKTRLKHSTVSQKIGRTMLHPIFAIPILGAVLLLIFLFIGVFLAQFVVEYTEGILMGTLYYNWVTAAVGRLFDADLLLGNLLIGQYGVLTMVPIYMLGLIFPLIVGFYFLLSLLEDSGILPRVSVLCDRAFTSLGLNGKAVIPMLLGFGCVTMALISTRILGSPRERTIAAALLCIAIPCSAQFSIMIVIASTLPAAYLAIYLGVVLTVFIMVGYGMNLILPGTSSDLFLVLPPMRLPQMHNVLRKTASKAKHFLKDAGPMFLLGGFFLSLLDYFNGFAVIYQWLQPVTAGLLRLPPESASLFLMSMIKRDLGAAELYAMVSAGTLSQPQTVVALTVVTFLVPCFASIAVLFKEQGKLSAVLIWLGSLAVSIGVGTVLAAVLL